MGGAVIGWVSRDSRGDPMDTYCHLRHVSIGLDPHDERLAGIRLAIKIGDAVTKRDHLFKDHLFKGGMLLTRDQRQGCSARRGAMSIS